MKKQVLLLSAALFGVIAYGQNTSDAIQNGQGNLATVDQVGNNDSSINQEFTDNNADVSQNGVNESLIEQSGNVGGSPASGMGNEAFVNQMGGNSEMQSSKIWQEGDLNHAEAMQFGNGNKSRIRQGGGQNAENNQAHVAQIGVDNFSRVRQSRDNHNAIVVQTGSDNHVFTRQAASSNQVTGNFSLLTQIGDNNKIDSKQKSTGTASFLGYSNGEFVFQSDNFNNSKLRQQGSLNASLVVQSGNTDSSAGTASGWSNRADVNQDGMLNLSGISQQDHVDVMTTDNNAVVSQTGNLGNLSAVQQSGANMATITQNN